MLPLQITPLFGFNLGSNRPPSGSTVKPPVFSGIDIDIDIEMANEDEYISQEQPEEPLEENPINPADWNPNWESVMTAPENVFLVKRIAWHLYGKAKIKGSMTIDDLISSGSIGLMDAARRYRSESGASFETYASQRIRGAILDEVRKNALLPRTAYENGRIVKRIKGGLEETLIRLPTSSEIKRELIFLLKNENEKEVEADKKIKIKTQVQLEKQAEKMLMDSKRYIFSYDDYRLAVFSEDSDSFLEELLLSSDSELVNANSPLQTLLDEEFDKKMPKLLKKVDKAIKALPEKEERVVRMLLEEEFTLEEIGEKMGVGKSRICQLRTQAKKRLREKIREIFS